MQLDVIALCSVSHPAPLVTVVVTGARFDAASASLLLMVLISHLTKALMLILKFLAEFVKRRLHLGKCGIGVFECVLIVLLLAWELQISDFEVT